MDTIGTPGGKATGGRLIQFQHASKIIIIQNE